MKKYEEIFLITPVRIVKVAKGRILKVAGTHGEQQREDRVAYKFSF